jgi:hypothetical protein
MFSPDEETGAKTFGNQACAGVRLQDALFGDNYAEPTPHGGWFGMVVDKNAGIPVCSALH